MFVGRQIRLPYWTLSRDHICLKVSCKQSPNNHWWSVSRVNLIFKRNFCAGSIVISLCEIWFNFCVFNSSLIVAISWHDLTLKVNSELVRNHFWCYICSSCSFPVVLSLDFRNEVDVLNLSLVELHLYIVYVCLTEFLLLRFSGLNLGNIFVTSVRRWESRVVGRGRR